MDRGRVSVRGAFALAPAVLGMALVAVGGCKEPTMVIVNVDNTGAGNPSLGFEPVYVIQEGQTLDLVVAPNNPAATVTTDTLPANAAFTENVFSFAPDFTQAGVYSVTFTADFGGSLVVETVGVRVQNVIHLNEPARVPLAEGDGTTLTFTSDDPPGTVVNYFSSLDSTPISGASFDPLTGELSFSADIAHLDTFLNPTIITVRAEGSEIDTGLFRVSEVSVVLDIEEVTSFATELQPIFDAACAFVGGCHAAAAAAANLILEPTVSYLNLVGAAPNGPSCAGIALEDALVTPGDTGESLLYTKVAGTASCGARMPLDCDIFGGCLTDAQIRKIQVWILGGALDD